MNGAEYDTACKDNNDSLQMTATEQQHVGEIRRHRCTYCQELFSNSRDLTRHTLHHMGLGPRQRAVAATCDSNPVNQSSAKVTPLKSHQNSSTAAEKEVVVCDLNLTVDSILPNSISSMSPKTRPSKTKQMPTTIEQLPFECKACDESFRLESQLTEHLCGHIESSSRLEAVQIDGGVIAVKLFDCSWCQAQFESATELTQHLIEHDDPRPHVCHCGRRFLTPEKLTKHRTVHAKRDGLRGRKSVEKKATFVCPQCEKGFVTRKQLAQHVRTHSDAKPFRCLQCGKAYKQAGHLSEHMKSHSGLRSFVCGLCDKRFIRNSHLMAHTRIHTQERPFSCPTCGRGFAQRCQLVVHERRHSGSRPYCCEVCGKSYPRTTELIIHRRVHSGEKPFRCSTCAKEFRTVRQLRDHERVHSGSRPFQCPICGKMFRQPSHVSEHVQVHNGTRAHSCGECGKQFRRRSHLEVHERTHTGVKPFQCSTCAAQFPQMAQLRLHERVHSGENPSA